MITRINLRNIFFRGSYFILLTGTLPLSSLFTPDSQSILFTIRLRSFSLEQFEHTPSERLCRTWTDRVKSAGILWSQTRHFQRENCNFQSCNRFVELYERLAKFLETFMFRALFVMMMLRASTVVDYFLHHTSQVHKRDFRHGNCGSRFDGLKN